jgi:hypothetical protein
MLGKLAPGDVVTVTRIDRLARSTFDLFGIVKRIADAKVQFRSSAEPWADTGTSTGRLMIAVLGGLADTPGGRAQPGAKARAAYGPSFEIDSNAAEGGPATPSAGRDPRRTSPQLRCGEKHDFKTHRVTEI